MTHSRLQRGNKTVMAGLLLAILTAGAFLAWWLVERADREMRADLIQQTRIVAQALNSERIKALSATEADLANPAYQRLKEQLATVRSANPQCRFVYLLGRKPDGTVFFFVDSEPATSEDYSPPGQVYAEVTESVRRVFSTQVAEIDGPSADRWGTWVSGLEPIYDPQTTMSGLATPDDARALVRAAVDSYRKNGRDRFLREVNHPQGPYRRGDLYVFVYDSGMTLQAHPVKPELVGQNQLEKKDWAGGKFFRREIQEVARTTGSGWVDYEYENPANKVVEPKTTYIERADDLIVCAGAYKGTGALIAVLGMDIDARDWRWMLARAALPPGLLALALAATLGAGRLRLARRAPNGHEPGGWIRHPELVLVVVTGLILTLFTAWMVQARERRDRSEAFAQLAASRTESVAKTLGALRDTELESLAHFYESDQEAALGNFTQFAAYLTKSPTVSAWELIPAVSASDKDRFEAEARAAGLPGFVIWQKDVQGQRVPVVGRDVYFPVFRVAPLTGNEGAVGYDLGSDPVLRAALDEAARTGLITCTAPTAMVQEPGGQKGMFICRPVFGGDDSRRLRGFALAVTRPRALLGSGTQDAAALLELMLLTKDGAPAPLAASWNADTPPLTGISASRPVFAFGRVFSVTAYAGPEFRRRYPMRTGGLALVIGLALTAALGAVVRVTLRQREELARLVADRTRELQESEQSYRNQFAANSSVMLLIDPADGAILDANAAAVGFYGYPRERLLALRITDINTLPAAETRQAMAAVAQGQGQRFEYQHRLADGTLRDVEVSSSRILFGGRTVLHSIIQDITDRKRAAAEVRELSQVVAQTPASVVITDLAGSIEYVNAAFVATTGYSVAEALGRNPRILKSGETPAETYGEMWRELKAGRIWRGELQNRAKDGRLFWELAVISPVKDSSGRITRYVAIKENITERKRAEDELRELNTDLEAQTVRANEMAAQAEMANIAKSEFLANMSHEIRTPMNGVLGMIGLLLDTDLTGDQRRYAQTVRASGEVLLALINDILDFSKIEAGKLELEKLDFSLHSLLDDFAGMMALRAHEKGLVLGCVVAPEVPADLRGDPSRLRQILINLTGNAIKFTAAGEVIVRVGVAKETIDEITLRFAVRDSGIGIPADKRGRLFSKFSQVDSSTTRTFGGTGLGLAISKQLAELMGGEIGVESEEGQGAEFWFTVRFAKAPGRDALSAFADLRGVRVLIVDDSPVNREILMVLLGSWGLRPAEAADGPSALRALGQAHAATDPFAIAILDMQMPGMDGLTLAQAIRTDPALRDLRLVMCTSLGQMVGDRHWEDVGFVASLTKPVRRLELHEVLDAAVRGGTLAEPRGIATPGARPGPRFRPARILVADDNITNQQVAVGILQKLGLRVEVAANGAEAVQSFETIPCDLILMDVQMPEVDGFEATRLIRKAESRRQRAHGPGARHEESEADRAPSLVRRIPVIAMTAHALQGDREKCLEAGMDDYVTKPVEVAALVQALEKWLRPRTEGRSAADAAGGEPAVPVGPAELPVFDRAGLMSRAMHDEALARVLITGFLADLPELVATLKRHVAGGDVARVELQAHKIKGAVATVGGAASSAVAAELEQAGRAADRALILDRMTELDAQLAVFTESLQKEVQSLRGA